MFVGVGWKTGSELEIGSVGGVLFGRVAVGCGWTGFPTPWSIWVEIAFDCTVGTFVGGTSLFPCCNVAATCGTVVWLEAASVKLGKNWSPAFITFALVVGACAWMLVPLEVVWTHSETLWVSVPWLVRLMWDKASFSSSLHSETSSVNSSSVNLASAIFCRFSSSSSLSRNACSRSRSSCSNCICWSFLRRSRLSCSCSSYSLCFSCWSCCSSISCFCFVNRNEVAIWRSSSSLLCFAMSSSFCRWLDVFDAFDLPVWLETVFLAVLDDDCEALSVAGNESI